MTRWTLLCRSTTIMGQVLLNCIPILPRLPSVQIVHDSPSHTLHRSPSLPPLSLMHRASASADNTRTSSTSPHAPSPLPAHRSRTSEDDEYDQYFDDGDLIHINSEATTSDLDEGRGGTVYVGFSVSFQCLCTDRSKLV